MSEQLEENGAPAGEQLDENQGAALAALQAGAAEQPAPGEEQPKAVELDCTAEADAIVAAAAGIVETRWPCLQYPEEARGQMSKVLAPVLKKYIGSAGFMARWGEEVALGIVIATTGYQSWKLVQEDKAAKAKHAHR